MEEQPRKEPVVRSKPTFVMIGDREIISNGRWNNDLMADYVMRHDACWITVGALSRTAYGNGSPRMKKRVRQCLPKLFSKLLSLGRLLVIEYGPPHNRAQAIKLYDPADQLDQQLVQVKIRRMRDRKTLSDDQYEKAMFLLAKQINGGGA
jgi:hypothetical protein